MLKTQRSHAQNAETSCSKCREVMLKTKRRHAQNAETSCSKRREVMLKMQRRHAQNARDVMLKTQRSHAQNAETSCSRCHAQNADCACAKRCAKGAPHVGRSVTAVVCACVFISWQGCAAFRDGWTEKQLERTIRVSTYYNRRYIYSLNLHNSFSVILYIQEQELGCGQ